MISSGNAIIACGQEREVFAEAAGDLGLEVPLCVDIRDRAGWSDQASFAGPKMAALVADALAETPPVKSYEVHSDGLCLVLGPAQVAQHAAESLAPFLGVTVLADPADTLPVAAGYDMIAGRLRQASGALGGFTVEIDALQTVEPGGRGDPALSPPRDGATAQVDVILDLTGGTPLFPSPDKREGYLRADPGSARAVAAAVLEASHLIGTFEKPLYVNLSTHLCAHERAGQAGCSKCLDVCPAGAILPAGDHVEIDPDICAGCGSCAALCPPGAIEFNDPAPQSLFRRVASMVQAYRAAGGQEAPALLVHDDGFGAQLISLAARYGRGLPASVIPLELGRVSGFGHAEMLAALASGFCRVDIVLAPTAERDALDQEIVLARALTGEGRQLRLLETTDPDILCSLLYETEAGPDIAIGPILAMGSRRQVARMATQALRGPQEEPIPLPENAPYGSVVVDTDACTLCLSCAALCPSGALGDNPDKPQLRFQEDACLQCGLCTNVCPENALSLLARMDLSQAALDQRVLHEEEPFECIECGKPFGVRSTIENIAAKLEGQHAMYATAAAARTIRMCDDCRVKAQFHSKDSPFATGERPRVRTTDDYLSKRRDH